MSFAESDSEGLKCFKYTFSRNMEFESVNSEASEKSVEHAVGNYRKGGKFLLYRSGELDISVLCSSMGGVRHVL